MQPIVTICCFLASAWVVASAGSDSCPTEVDILYVVDASGSIDPNDFDKVKAKLADHVIRPIGDMDVDAAFLQYGSFIEVIVNFGHGVDLEEVVMEFLYYDGGQSFTNEALDQAGGFFTERRGGRPDALKYIVVLTDGNHTMESETIEAARALRDAGFILAGVGLGTSVRMEGIENIASTDYVFDCSNLDDFEDFSTRFISNVEQEVMHRCGECSADVDMLIIVDVSQSVTEDVVDELKGHIGNLIDMTPYGGLSMDFALMQFSTFQEEIVPFTGTPDWAGPAARYWLYFHGHQSLTHKALREVTSYFKLGRTSALKYVVIFTDGDHSSYAAAVHEADALKADDYVIAGFGVGPNVDLAGLEAICSEDYVYDGSDLSSIENKFELFSSKIQSRVQGDCEKSDMCSQKVDALLVIDVSASIEEANFDWLKVQLMELVNRQFGDISMDYAILTFTEYTNDILYFTDDYPVDSVIDAWVYFEGHTSKSHLALERSPHLFAEGRVDASKYVFFFSDGHHTDAAAAQTAAENLRGDGVEIVTVGVGKSVDMAGLELIASQGRSYDGSGVADLNGIFDEIVDGVVQDMEVLCQAV